MKVVQTMATAELVVTIKRPVEEVFAVLINLENAPKWSRAFSRRRRVEGSQSPQSAPPSPQRPGRYAVTPTKLKSIDSADATVTESGPAPALTLPGSTRHPKSLTPVVSDTVT